MSTETHQEAESASTAAALHAAALARHGSSKMLASYLGDIEQLVRERLWAEAVPLALALPHVCAALADPTLCSSRAQFLDWCECWVRPPTDDTSLTVPAPEALYRLAHERGVAPELEPADEQRVPVQALRQLRLRRLSRAAPPPRRVSLTALREAAEDPAREACVALLHAVRRWYSDWAALQPTVQGNLARLAVLR